MLTPSSASTAAHRLPENILLQLCSPDAREKLQALREVKNQIIGNRTKKLSFLKLGAVPAVVSALASAAEEGFDLSLIVQSAAAVGSFACGFDTGVKAVLDSSAFPVLEKLISYPDDKLVVVTESVFNKRRERSQEALSWFSLISSIFSSVLRSSGDLVRLISSVSSSQFTYWSWRILVLFPLPSLSIFTNLLAIQRSIVGEVGCGRCWCSVTKNDYQSKFAPKYEFFPGKQMDFILSLMNNENENLNGLGLSIITHSCKTSVDQKTLCEAGIKKKIIDLLNGSINMRDACLESLTTLINANTEVIAQLETPVCGTALSSIKQLTNDKSPRTRLLACSFLTVLRNSDPTHLQDASHKIKLMQTLLELVDDAGQVGEDALFVLSDLIANKEDIQSLPYDVDAVDRLCSHFSNNPLSAKRLNGILLALAGLCSVQESCRSKLLLYTQALNWITDALTDDNPEVRAAACICLRNLSRSVQFKSVFIEFGGLNLLIELSKSMDSEVRVKAVKALRNMMFHADKKLKEEILSDLTIPFIECLIQDAETFVQEQALAMVRNLVDGSISNIDFVFAADSVMLNAVCKQLQNAEVVEVQIQGMCVLCNVAIGNELHKDAVSQKVAPEASSGGLKDYAMLESLLK